MTNIIVTWMLGDRVLHFPDLPSELTSDFHPASQHTKIQSDGIWKQLHILSQSWVLSCFWTFFATQHSALGEV
jgi:hypothetical protein